MRKIPLVALQKAVYETLCSYQDVPVYDDVPKDAHAPYITIGAFTCRTNGTKLNDITDCSLQVHVWSEYHGKKEVNSIANDVIAILGTVKLDLQHFKVLSQEITMFESFSEDEDGYHGVITLDTKIEHIGG